MGVVDVKALSYEKQTSPRDFVNKVVMLAEASLPLFLLDTDPGNATVNAVCDPCFGVSVRVRVTGRTNFGAKDPRKLKGADVSVTTASSSLSPSEAALAAKLLADAAAFATLADIVFRDVAVIHEET